MTGWRIGCAIAAACAAAVMATGAALAQEFPARPLRFVVPFPAGPAGDLVGRHYAKRFTDLTGQPVVVDNKPGGNGFIGVQAALAAPADGYTVFIGSNSTLSANVALFRKLPYDPVADLAPVHGLMRSPMVVLVAADKRHQKLADLVRAARQAPQKFNYSAGTSAYQLMTELFLSQAGIAGVHVPYKGGMEAVKAVIGGETEFTVIDLTAPLPLIRAGRLRALAVATDKRITALPEVPTAAEAGVENFNVAVWVAAFVRADVPRPVQERLTQIFARIATSAETREHYAAQNAEPMSEAGDALRRFQVREIELWKRVAAVARIEPQ